MAEFYILGDLSL